MGVVFNSSKTADTVNRAIDNSMGTTTTTQGAAAAGKIITEDLQPVVQCTGGYTNPFIVKSISGVPPVEFHAVEGNLKFWAISGNTVEGASVGDKTNNLFTAENATAGYITQNGGIQSSSTLSTSDFLELPPNTEKITSAYTYTEGSALNTPSLCFYDENKDFISGEQYARSNPKTFTVPTGAVYFKTSFRNDTITMMINVGATAADFEPYGYKIPVECANITYNCYISDVLRKSSGETPVYDVMDSTGTVTRNVDTDGTPLETPTTETYTAPTITTIWGYNEFDVDTTVTPSNVTVQYYDN